MWKIWEGAAAKGDELQFSLGQIACKKFAFIESQNILSSNLSRRRCILGVVGGKFFHRRRIKTEKKAKVVACVWGEEMIQFLAALAVLHWMSFVIG